MLLGGMKVVGIYIWVNESLFKNSTITLFQVLLLSYLLFFITFKYKEYTDWYLFSIIVFVYELLMIRS